MSNDILKKALDESVQKEMSALPSRQELDEMYPSSDILDNKVKKIIGKNTASASYPIPRRNFTRFTKFAAVFAAALITGIAITITNQQNLVILPDAPTAAAPAPAAAPEIAAIPEAATGEYIPFAQFDYATDGEFAITERGFNFEDENWYAPLEPVFEIYGFYHIMTEYLDNMSVTTYNNANNDILMVVRNDTINLNDAINAITAYGRGVTNILVAGHDVTLFDPIDFNQQVAMWELNGVVYHVIADIDMQEFVQLLEVFFN